MCNQFGQLVSTIVNETKPAGAHSTQAQTTGLADGMYFYQLMIGSDVITGKLIVQ